MFKQLWLLFLNHPTAITSYQIDSPSNSTRGNHIFTREIRSLLASHTIVEARTPSYPASYHALRQQRLCPPPPSIRDISVVHSFCSGLLIQPNNTNTNAFTRIFVIINRCCQSAQRTRCYCCAGLRHLPQSQAKMRRAASQVWDVSEIQTRLPLSCASAD